MPATFIPTQPSSQDEADLALMSAIPPEVADRIDQLFAFSRHAASRDGALGDMDAYPALVVPRGTMQPEGQIFPVRTDVHTPQGLPLVPRHSL